VHNKLWCGVSPSRFVCRRHCPPATDFATAPLPPPTPPNHGRLCPASVPRAFEVIRPAQQHVVAVRLVVSDERVHRHRCSVVVAAGAGRQPSRFCGRWYNRRRRRHCGHRYSVHRRCQRVHRSGHHSGHRGQHPRHHRHSGHRRQRPAAVRLRFTSPEAVPAAAGSYTT